jgi:hypothetical protein
MLSDPSPRSLIASEHDTSERDDSVETPNGDYLDRLMRRESFQALWPLFALAPKPAKELTESFSALCHLRPFMPRAGACRVLHVGDGAHARTGALFALKSRAHNISVDPIVNDAIVDGWRVRFGVERFEWRRSLVQDVAAELNALPPLPTLVTFVHAHVDVDDVLRHLRWDAAYTLACCVPGRQFSTEHAVVASGIDKSVLSSSREFQVLANRRI